MTRRILSLFIVLSLCPVGGFAFRVDAPKADVSRPKTPHSSGVYPRTAAGLSSKPSTPSGLSSKPRTQVEVARPSTFVEDSVYPRTPDLGQIRPRTALGGWAAVSGGSSTASSSSGAVASTSMSGYKPKEAKDFKAPGASASLGGGNTGLGGMNAADASERDSAAKNSVIAEAGKEGAVKVQSGEEKAKQIKESSVLDNKAAEARKDAKGK